MKDKLVSELWPSLCLHQNLRKMEQESSEEPVRDLNELQNADWVRKQTLDLQTHLIISPD